MMLWMAPSTRSGFKNALLQREDSNHFTLDVAKGEYASVQIFVRNNCRTNGTFVEENNLKIIHVTGGTITQTEGEAFDVSAVKIRAQEYISFADGITYPDAISNDCVADIYPSTTQSFWVHFYIPQNQPHGNYSFRIELESDFEEEMVAFAELKVYDVVVPTPDKGEYSMEHFTHPESQVGLDHAGYDCKAYDEKWWQFMDKYVDSLVECRSNVFRLSTLSLLKAAGSRKIGKGKWHLDFSVFDKMIELVMKKGLVKRLALDDILTEQDGVAVYALDEKGEIVKINSCDPEADAWLVTLFKALYEHITRYGTPDNWIVHIQDEPLKPAMWLHARELVKQHMPGFICGNPTCDNIEPKLGDAVDLYIPVFFQVEDEIEFYEKMVANPEKEVWSYCCCGPSSAWYLNRFIDRPAIYSRMIGWATYSRGFTGFLHYGYSYWQKTDQFAPFGIDEYTQHKGDCMLIYPSPEDWSYKATIRFINIRDGAQDYEILKIAEKADAEKAKEISKSVAIGYRDFNADEKHFLNARRKLLELAEKKK